MRACEFLVEYRTPKPVLTKGTADYNGIVIGYEANRKDQVLMIQAFSPQGNELGFVKFTTGPGGYSVPLRTYRDLEALELSVDERYRGQGIAQTMYDFVKSQGYKIYRSDDQTDAGAAFWDKNRGGAEVWENFADGKKPGRKGLAKRMGVNCKQSVSKLRKIAKNSSGERARMAHWCANMKAGKKK